MPMYHYKCDKCGARISKILANAIAAQEWGGSDCTNPQCSRGRFRRAPRAPSSRVTETLDNGVMARRLERPADAERLFEEHVKQDRKLD